MTIDLAPWEIAPHDVATLRQFADTEIGSGRFLSGARLRALLDFYEERSKLDFKELLEDNETLARELAGEIEKSFKQARTMTEALAEMEGSLAKITARITPPPPAPKKKGRTATAKAPIDPEAAAIALLTEAITLFRKPLQALTTNLIDLGTNLRQHQIDAALLGESAETQHRRDPKRKGSAP